MTPLILPHIFNIIVLVPVGLMTLLAGWRGGQWLAVAEVKPIPQNPTLFSSVPKPNFSKETTGGDVHHDDQVHPARHQGH